MEDKWKYNRLDKNKYFFTMTNLVKKKKICLNKLHNYVVASMYQWRYLSLGLKNNSKSLIIMTNLHYNIMIVKLALKMTSTVINCILYYFQNCLI